MTIEKINSNSVSQQIQSEKLTETAVAAAKKKKAAEAYKNEVVAPNTDSVEISDKAKQYQETEAILRSALQKLHELDDIRNEKLSDVDTKVDSDYYNSDEFNSLLADQVLQDSSISDDAAKTLMVEKYVEKLKSMDSESIATESDVTETDNIQSKITEEIKPKEDEGNSTDNIQSKITEEIKPKEDEGNSTDNIQSKITEEIKPKEDEGNSTDNIQSKITEEIDTNKEEIEEKIASGFYNDPTIVEKTADNLLNLTL